MKRTSVLLMFLLLLLMCATSAEAVRLWSTSFSQTMTESDKLIYFDSASPGSVTFVGSTNAPENEYFEGLDFTRSGTLYGYTNVMTPTTSGYYTLSSGYLYSINTATGVATKIGGGGFDSGPYGEFLVDMAYNPANDTMYALQLWGYAQYRQAILYTIDLGTGLASKVGIVSPENYMFASGLAADASGKLYILDALDGTVWSLQGLNATKLPNDTGFDALTGTGITIDWSGDGTMYMGGLENWFDPTPLAKLWTVDLNTGIGTYTGLVGPTGLEIRGPEDLAIYPNTEVPEPTTMLLPGSGLLGLWGARKKFKK